jgi:hypothetical protein
MDSLRKQKNVALDTLMPMIRQELAEGRSVRFGPRGISMLPMLRQGLDTVTISPVPEKLKKYDLPLYQRDNGKYILHRVIGVGETYTCLGDNQFAKEYGVRHDQIIGLVTEFTRGERTISAKNKWYQLYCRVWAIIRFPRRCWRKLRSLLK